MYIIMKNKKQAMTLELFGINAKENINDKMKKIIIANKELISTTPPPSPPISAYHLKFQKILPDFKAKKKPTHKFKNRK